MGIVLFRKWELKKKFRLAIVAYTTGQTGYMAIKIRNKVSNVCLFWLCRNAMTVTAIFIYKTLSTFKAFSD